MKLIKPKHPEGNYRMIVQLLTDNMLTMEQIARLVGVHRTRVSHVAAMSGMDRVRAKAEKAYQRKAKESLKKLRKKLQ